MDSSAAASGASFFRFPGTRSSPPCVTRLRFGSSTTTSRNITPCRSCSTYGIILVGIVTVLSGLSIWKPVQLSELAMLFYDFQTARLVHFLCMTAIVMFLIVHVALTLLVPQTFIAMLTGGPVIKTDEPRAGARPV